MAVIPSGGNWKHIPLNIPSKRLDRIRETGAEQLTMEDLGGTIPPIQLPLTSIGPEMDVTFIQMIHPKMHSID